MKPSAGFIKYSTCMGSHVARDITMPPTSKESPCEYLSCWMVHLFLNINYSNFHLVDFLVWSTTLKVGALEVKRRISVKKAPLSLCPK